MMTFVNFIENDDFITISFLSQIMETKYSSVCERTAVIFRVGVGCGRRDWVGTEEDLVEKTNGKEQITGIPKDEI